MASTFETVANSSGGDGLAVSLDRGKRKEEFKNTEKYWYYARELVLDGTYRDFEMKAPGLGDLSIYRAEWKDDGEQQLVARFSKGSWDYVRLIESETEEPEPSAPQEMMSEDNRNICPEGCWIRGWEDLGEATQLAHMQMWHSGGKFKSPFK